MPYNNNIDISRFDVPSWMTMLAQQYPTYIKTISGVTVVHVNDIDYESHSNSARANTSSRHIIGQLAESFATDGFFEDEEPILVLKRPVDLLELSRSKPYAPPCCFHRIGGGLLAYEWFEEKQTVTDENGKEVPKSTFTGHMPAVYFELHDGLTKHQVDYIKAVIALEENSKQKLMQPTKLPDLIEAAMRMVDGLRINGRPATPDQQVEWLHEELKKLRRSGNTLFNRYEKIRKEIKGVKPRVGAVQRVRPLQNFALAQEWAKTYYDKKYVWNGYQLDMLTLTSDNNKGKLVRISSQLDDSSFVYYWPANRIDRNLNDIYSAVKKMKEQGMNRKPILLFLSVNTLDGKNLNDDRKSYAKEVIEMITILDEKYREMIDIVGFLPQGMSEDRGKIIPFREFVQDNIPELEPKLAA